MTLTTEQILLRIPSPPGAPLGYGEFWMPHRDRDRDEWYVLWQRVILRDGRWCFYCKRPMSFNIGRSGTLDHIVPRIRGGSDHFSNLRAACDPCNRAKGEFLPETGPHHCVYPPSNYVEGLCYRCLRPRRVPKSRQQAQRTVARLAAGPHECLYVPHDDPDALCEVCCAGRGKSNRRALNKRLRKAH